MTDFFERIGGGMILLGIAFIIMDYFLARLTQKLRRPGVHDLSDQLMLLSVAKPEQRLRVRFANLNYEAAVTHRMRRGGLFVTAAGVVLVLVSISGCGKSVSSSDIAAYGVDRFVTNVLVFGTTHALPESIQREFSPKRVQEHLNGVLLVYSESSRSIQGIYVDREVVTGWDGSGFEVEPWFQQVAWVHIKKRSTKQLHLKQAAEEVALIDGYYSSDLKAAENSLLGLVELSHKSPV